MRIYRQHHLIGKKGIIGYCRTKLYYEIKAGKFPAPNIDFRDNPNDSKTVKPIHGWTSDLIEDWIASKRTDKS